MAFRDSLLDHVLWFTAWEPRSTNSSVNLTLRRFRTLARYSAQRGGPVVGFVNSFNTFLYDCQLTSFDNVEYNASDGLIMDGGEVHAWMITEFAGHCTFRDEKLKGNVAANIKYLVYWEDGPLKGEKECDSFILTVDKIIAHLL